MDSNVLIDLTTPTSSPHDWALRKRVLASAIKVFAEPYGSGRDTCTLLSWTPMTSSNTDRDWKLKLRYGQLSTPFNHYTSITEGVVDRLVDGFECRLGPAFMSMKTWAESPDEASHMARLIGEQIGFRCTGEVLVYDTEPHEPPVPNPRGYAIRFTLFDA